ncbi:MAG TPA: hypothetical protein VIM75_14095 [Ohtaekwangia sp.]|uniref:hypothetical protein n=1 Tax=Ohtaekwangia sp. TaxID=2066019 RepID=UPI002F95B798
MNQGLYVILLLGLISCKTPVDKLPDNELRGKWIVNQIVERDSTLVNDTLPGYNSDEQLSGSLFYKSKELGSTIELLENGTLKTKLVFTNFGTLTWTTNKQMDSLNLKLTNVKEESLIADGTVSNKGELFLYEGTIKFVDHDNIDWILSDGRIFKLKRKPHHKDI